MPITREQWEALSDKARWDVKVALRGPDAYNGEVLKWFTTSVIRGQVREVFRVGGLVNHDLQLVVLPSAELASTYKASKTSWNYKHFVEHVGTAADWLGVPKLRIEPSVWHAAMQAGSSKQAIQTILDAAQAWEGSQYPYITLYKSAHLKELERHMNTGHLYA